MKKNTEEAIYVYSNRLRLFREKKGYSQEKVAEDIKISCSTYKKLESGETALSVRYLCSLNEAYGLSSDEILFGKNFYEKNKKSELITNCSERDKMHLLLSLSSMRAKNKRGKKRDEKGSYFRG